MSVIYYLRVNLYVLISYTRAMFLKVNDPLCAWNVSNGFHENIGFHYVDIKRKGQGTQYSIFNIRYM